MPVNDAALAVCSTETKDLIWACIHDSFRRAEARACYDEARKSEPDIAGHVVVAWTVNDKGAVTGVRFDEINSTIKSVKVRECIAPIFQRIKWNLGKRGHVRTGVYDFKFTPNG